MKLSSVLFFTVLLNILQFINAYQRYLYQDNTAKKWFGLAVLNNNQYEVTQECIQIYFVPQMDSNWTVIMVEYFKSSDHTAVRSKNMNTSELNNNHENSAQIFKDFINYDSQRHFIFYESNRHIFIVLSKSIDDQINIVDETVSTGWTFTSIAKDTTCGNNGAGSFDRVNELLRQAIINWVSGQWYAVAILRNSEINQDLDCMQKYFIPQDENTITYVSLQTDALGRIYEYAGNITSEMLFDVYDRNMNYIRAMLRLDDNEYFFVAENSQFYYILSRSPKVDISVKETISIHERITWILQSLDQENCDEYVETVTKTSPNNTTTEIITTQTSSYCQNHMFPKLCKPMQDISVLSTNIYNFLVNHGSFFKLLKRISNS